MGLHICVLRAEQALRAVDRKLLDLVDEFAAPVPAPARIALGVLVGQHAALGLQDGGVGEVLRGDQLDVALLAPELGGYCRIDFRVEGV